MLQCRFSATDRMGCVTAQPKAAGDGAARCHIFSKRHRELTERPEQLPPNQNEKSPDSHPSSDSDPPPESGSRPPEKPSTRWRATPKLTTVPAGYPNDNNTDSKSDDHPPDEHQNQLVPPFKKGEAPRLQRAGDHTATLLAWGLPPWVEGDSRFMPSQNADSATIPLRVLPRNRKNPGKSQQ